MKASALLLLLSVACGSSPCREGFHETGDQCVVDGDSFNEIDVDGGNAMSTCHACDCEGPARACVLAALAVDIDCLDACQDSCADAGGGCVATCQEPCSVASVAAQADCSDAGLICEQHPDCGCDGG